MSDFELLQAYVQGGDEDAFTEVVNRYMNLVYSAALRQSSDPHTAAEIVQSVFIILARKASRIQANTIMAGWLLRATRYTANNARRNERYRQQLEQQAMENLCTTESESAWTEIAPVLDEALILLNEPDRNAIALRFFAHKSYKEIGETLSSSEEGARKRVNRALERLRGLLVRRGTLLSAGAIAGAISAHGVQAAPAQLATPVVSAALAKAAVSVGTLPFLAKATLQTLDRLRLRSLVLRGATASLAVAALILATINVTQRAVAPAAGISRKATTGLKPGQSAQPAAPLAAFPASGSSTNGSLVFRVIDPEDGKPVSNARVTLTSITEYPNRTTNVCITGPNGESLVSIDRRPVPHWNFRIEVFKDGYVPKYVSWSDPQHDSINDIPAEYTTKLTRGIEIGGLVVNEEDHPIEGVRVVFSVSGESPGASSERERLTMMGRYHTEITDSEGRWRCSHVPSQFSMISYQLLHPDYVATSFGSSAIGGPSSGMNYLSESDLRAGTAKALMKKGFIIAGVVTDETGAPVSGAKVTQNRNWYEPLANTNTTSDGHFQFGNLPMTEFILTVQADGFSPKEQTIHPAGQRQELVAKLDRGGLLRVRILDDESNPIRNATVSFAADALNNKRFEWHANTDGDGAVEWTNAPVAKEAYVFGASGFISQTSVELAGDGAEHIVTMKKAAQSSSFRFSGTVMDEATRQPIEEFQVLLGSTEKGLPPSGGWTIFSPRLRAKGKNGAFSFQEQASATDYVLELQADGYWPTQVTNSGPLTADRHFEICLKRGEGINGKVLGQNGKPVAGATVLLCGAGVFAYINLPAQFNLTRSAKTQSVETDADGRFAFKPQLNVNCLRVAHPQGYAEASLKDQAGPYRVTLKPWSRVEGVLKIGNRVGAQEVVRLNNWFWRYGIMSSLQLHLESTTDDEGRFAFEGVPPGELELSHLVYLKPGKTRPDASDRIVMKTARSSSILLRPWTGQTQRTFVQVEPGATAHINLGGTGRRVIGTVKADAIPQQFDWQADLQSFTPDAARPPAPLREKFSSDAEFKTSWDQWSAQERIFWLSDAGRKLQLESHPCVPLFATNGSFRIDDVLPGIYQLKIRIADPSASEGSFGGRTLGVLDQEVIVPEAGADPNPPAVDLGILELTPSRL